MGRAGSGGRSGGHSSSHHSSSHRTSSHHVSRSSSGHRAGGSSHMSHGSSFGGGYHRHIGPTYHRHYHYGPGHSGPGYGPRPRSIASSITSWIFTMTFFIIVFMIVVGTGTSNIPASTYNREKVSTGVTFDNDCIVDELGWFDNITSTERKLQSFYNETGVQPYIVLFDYNPDLISDSECEEFAEDWYAENIDNEGTLLFAYFAEKDTDNDVGTMTLVNGKQISSVMDSEAIEIFWAYTDEYWYSDLSTDDMFVKIFDKTAERIMTKSTTGADVGMVFGIGFAVIAVGVVVIIVMNKKRANEKARNEETERILKSDIKDIEDDTLNKYL